MKPFELIPHTADLKLYAYGATQKELFSNALKGMFASIKPKSQDITYDGDIPIMSSFTTEQEIVIHADELDLLLVDFLSEALYLSDIHNEAYFEARFTTFSDKELAGKLYGVPIEGFEVVEIKAVTYHDLKIEQIDGIWRATLVFDI